MTAAPLFSGGGVEAVQVLVTPPAPVVPAAEAEPVPVAVPAPAPAPVVDVPASGEVLDPPELTLFCDYPRCSEAFTGPPGGRGSAPFQLSKHRWSKHKLRKDDPTPTAAEVAGRGPGKAQAPVVDVLTDPHPVAATIAAAGKAVKGTGAPRADQLANALGLALSVVTQGAARWAVGTDPLVAQAIAADPATGAEATEALVGSLSLSKDAAAMVLAPVARILAPTALNRKFGRAVVDNTDLGPALVELADVGRVWVSYLGQRRQAIALQRQALAQMGQAPGVVPTPAAQAAAAAATGPGSAPLPPVSHVDPTLGTGRVATARHP